MSFKNFKNRISKRLKGSTLFQDKFGFENGIDITDDNLVLHRKNVVIKNIVFVVNIIYTIIFTIISIGDPTNSSNWLLTLLLFPVTALINHMLNRLINKGPSDNLSQVMAMYVAAFYMIASSILVYIKLKYGEVTDTTGTNYLSEAGYILIYISLLISAFYQDKKMLKNIYVWVLVIVTILHFTVTYAIVEMAQNSDIWETLKTIFTGTAIRDILIRTILLLAFMLILYIYVSMTNYMQDERKKEQAKRRRIQNEYVESITKIFDITIPKITITDDDRHENLILCGMVKKLSSLLAKKPEEIDEIVDFTRLLIDNTFKIEFSDELDEDSRFNVVLSNTELGKQFVERINLKKKSDEILRHVLDNINDDEFIKRIREEIADINYQIILICDIYISMRSVRSFKKAYNHKHTMEILENNFKVFFDSLVYDRFQRFGSDFEAIYNEE